MDSVIKPAPKRARCRFSRGQGSFTYPVLPAGSTHKVCTLSCHSMEVTIASAHVHHSQLGIAKTELFHRGVYVQHRIVRFAKSHACR